MFAQAKVYMAAAVGVLIAALAGLAGYFKLRVAQKDKQISDIKKDSLQHAVDQLQDANQASHDAGVKADAEAKTQRDKVTNGDRSFLE